MSNKENNLKEKFKIALNSTAKVIADDFQLKQGSSCCKVDYVNEEASLKS